MIEITLEQLLESRDSRAEMQRELLAGYGTPLVSFTVNMPGKVKLNRQSKLIYAAGVFAIRECLAGHIMYIKMAEKLTGPEAFFAVEMEAHELKRRMCELESEHPLGRLFDIDVLREDGTPISRSELSLPPRKCLICDGDGAACARSRAHTVEQLMAKIDEMIEKYEGER